MGETPGGQSTNGISLVKYEHPSSFEWHNSTNTVICPSTYGPSRSDPLSRCARYASAGRSWSVWGGDVDDDGICVRQQPPHSLLKVSCTILCLLVLPEIHHHNLHTAAPNMNTELFCTAVAQVNSHTRLIQASSSTEMYCRTAANCSSSG